MNKIIKKKTKPNTNETNHNQRNLLKKITYITIILHFILQVIVIYYDNKIPWLTTGINNLKSIIPGGK